MSQMERYFVTKEARDAGFSVLDNSKGWGGGAVFFGGWSHFVFEPCFERTTLSHAHTIPYATVVFAAAQSKKALHAPLQT